MARLTPTQVLRIRELYAAGNTMTTLADAFSRHPGTISDIVHNRSHKRVRATLEQMPRRPRTGESLKDRVEKDIAQHGTAAGRFRGPNRVR